MALEHPLDGITPTGLTSFDSSTHFGRVLRKADARRQLSRLDEQQPQHQAELKRIANISNRLLQIREVARYNVEHLLAFGVMPAEREEFQRILRPVATTGELTLREAADQARQRGSYDSNGTGRHSSNADGLSEADVILPPFVD